MTKLHRTLITIIVGTLPFWCIGSILLYLAYKGG
jgi:hypothetical protein